MVIDPGANAEKIREKIAETPEEKVLAILLTHAHYDHIGAVDELHALYQCPVYLSRGDWKLSRNEDLNRIYSRSAKITCEETDYPSGDLVIGPFTFQVYETPGHSAGSVCLRCDDCLFTGDTLFAGSAGRTDLYSGSEWKLRESLRLLAGLDPKLKVYPGHEGSTTLEEELRTNPYLRQEF